ncbi:hypothetical protein ABI59_17580 [Acidobacteria bacterium Mor1]|nr:hypothetical protein ABI59_17580 [Acidobacteria bacterium Mor1]
MMAHARPTQGLENARPYWTVQFVDFFGSALWLLTASLFWIAELGFRPVQVATLLTVGWILQIIFEVPSGTWSDLFGHRRAVVYAFVAQVVYALIYIWIAAAAPEGGWDHAGVIYWCIAGEAFKKLGLALLSGSLETWASGPIRRMQSERQLGEQERGQLYDQLEIPAKKRVTFGLTLGGALAFLLVGSGASWWIVWAIPAATNTILAGYMLAQKDWEHPSPRRGTRGRIRVRIRRDFARLVTVVSEFLFHGRDGRRFLVLMVVNAVAFSLVYFVSALWAPLVYYMDAGRFSSERGGFLLAAFWGAISSGAILGAYLSKGILAWMRRKEDPLLVFSMLLFFIGAIFFLLWSITSSAAQTGRWIFLLSAVVLAGYKFCEGLLRPLSATLIQQAISSDRTRATLLSVESYVRALFASFVLLLIGFCGEYGFELMWLSAAAIAILVASFIWSVRGSPLFGWLCVAVVVGMALFLSEKIATRVDAVAVSQESADIISISSSPGSADLVELRVETGGPLAQLETLTKPDGRGLGVQELRFAWDLADVPSDDSAHYSLHARSPIALFLDHGERGSQRMEPLQIRDVSQEQAPGKPAKSWKSKPFSLIDTSDWLVLGGSFLLLVLAGLGVAIQSRKNASRHQAVLAEAARTTAELRPDRLYEEDKYPIDVIGFGDVLKSLGVARYAFGFIDWNDRKALCVLTAEDPECIERLKPFDSTNVRIRFSSSEIWTRSVETQLPAGSTGIAPIRWIGESDIDSDSEAAVEFLREAAKDGRAAVIPLACNGNGDPGVDGGLLLVFDSRLGATEREIELLHRVAENVSATLRLSHRHFLNFHSEYDSLDYAIRKLVHGVLRDELRDDRATIGDSYRDELLNAFDNLRRIRHDLGERLNGTPAPRVAEGNLLGILKYDLLWFSRLAGSTARARKFAGEPAFEMTLQRRLDRVRGDFKVRLLDFWIAYANLLRNAINHSGASMGRNQAILISVECCDLPDVSGALRVVVDSKHMSMTDESWVRHVDDALFLYRDRRARKGLLLAQDAARRMGGSLQRVDREGRLVPALVIPIETEGK